MRTLRLSLLITALSSFIFSNFVQAQTNLLTVDFETADAGYTPSTATGSGFTDLFNRTDANLSASNETGFYWGIEDFDGTQTIVLDQVDVTGFSAFNFGLDWVTHHTNDWDAGSYVHITYTLDGGSPQNLLWVENVPNGSDRTNEPAAVDTDFDGDGECANSLPALSTATNGCDIGANRGDFETYVTSDVSLPSGASALVITIEFNDMNQTDQGIYLDNIVVNGVGTASTAEMDYYNLQWPANGTIDVGGSFTAYAQGYEAGVTDIGNNPGTGVECWIGYSTTDASTTADFDGAGWTWVPASFSSQQGNNNEFSVDFGSAISTPGTYYYVSRWSLENGPYTYGGFQNAWDGTTVPSGVLTVNDVTMDYANLQSPQNGSITVGGNFDVYAQGYEPGVTEAGGAGTGVQCWIGYSSTDATTSADFAGANWTWVPATFGSQQGNNDEFVAEIGSGLTPGSYYYVSRWQLGSGSYTYGGYNGGAWDGTANVSGSLTVDPLIIPACTQLFISEYVEGSSSNKYIELYNPTASTVDLTGYRIALYGNGSTSVTSSYEFSGTLNAYSTIVLRNSGANIYAGNAIVDTGGTFFNGDDAVALSYNGTNIDVIGQIGVDPGSSWGGLTANTTLVRKSTVQAGDTDGSNAFDASVEWDAFPIDDESNLGSHTSDCAPASLPTLSFSNATGLTTLDYAQGSGPSGEGSITLTLVDGDGAAVDVTAPSGFSISSTSGSGYVSTLSPVFSSNQTFTYNVTASSMMDYTISGTDRNGSVSGLDPSISISTGDTLSFEINAGPTHPFVISSVGTLPSNPITGVTNNGATSGFVTWAPTVAGTYYYICDNHPNMVGTINVTDAYPSSGTATLYVIQNAGNPSGTNSGDLTASGAGASSINQTVSGVVSYSFGPCTQLFISEYGEPSSGNGKYIELYNPTNADIDLANFELWKITNGGSWAEATLSLTGQIPSYGTFVIGNNQTDVPSADLTSSGVVNFSGDDAVGLAWNGGSGASYTLIDAVGEEGADPGSGWTVDGVSNATQNNVLVRKRTVDGPTTDWATSSASEWIVLSYSQDSLDAHTSDCAPNLCASFMVSAVVDANASCNGSLDGGATASATGGALPYSYVWSNSATTASITGVASSLYTVTVSDANGCSESASVTITEPVAVTASAVVDANVSTAGGSDGAATASATGGTLPYSYLWSNSATTASITGVVAGTYSVTVSDANGCQSSSSVTITEPAPEVMDYYNLHFPGSGTINVGQSFDVYAQGYEDGVTNVGSNPGSGVECWIGYSTTDAIAVTDFTGSNWTWVAASYLGQSTNGNNNEFTLDLGSNLTTPGTYYYVSRWSLNGGPYSYGGTNSSATSTGGGDAWDGATFLSGVLAVNGSVAPSTCTQLFISEYGEPSSGLGKYIEVYNPTNSDIDLANFELWRISNGGSWPEATLPLTGQIPSYGTFVSGHNQTDVPSADLTNSGFFSFNGDDAVGLAWNGGSGNTFTLIDAVGTDGPDPGSGWAVDGVSNATQNNVLVRKRTVDGPTTDWAASSASEWIVLSYSQDSLDAHTSDCYSPSTATMDFVNLQFPASGTITAATTFEVFAQGYEAGVTEAAGAGAGVECWIGYSTTDATTTADFATGWTWEPAMFNTEVGNNDEFTADIGVGITNAGTYYYVSRWRLDGGPFTYGGYNGGAWDGSSNVSGVLTVNPVSLPDLILNEIHADPSNAAGEVGDANGDGTAVYNQDEFIEIYNNEATSVDLAGYMIKDNGTMVHTFPATGSVLPAGGYAVVFGGGTPTGVSGDVVQVSSQGDLSLSNGSATISLENASGIEVFTYSYSGAGNNQSIARNPDLTGAFVDHTTIPATGRLFSAGSVNVTAVCDLAISSVSVDANVSSNGGSDGALTVSTTGGTAPLTYAWTGGATTASITGLSAGNYVVTVTDANGCLATDSATVTEPGPATPIVELSIDNGNIVEGQTATVTATASGAVSSDETVTLTVTGVDATDYTLGSITILSGQTTGTATFTAVDDSDDEITEEAVIAISALSAGLDSGSVVSVKEYITDNDNTTLTVPISQSFENVSTGDKYFDESGLGDADHDLYNTAGDQPVDLVSAAGVTCNTDVWINEIHYDNAGSDVDEGFEIAGPAGTNLSGYSVWLYNGSNGTHYSTNYLNFTLTDLGNGVGVRWFSQSSGMQNGAPDGLALYDGTEVVQFISYEGSFTATSGVAQGLTSVDIGVSETNSTPVGESLQLTGSGSSYADFTWSAPATHTRDLANNGQTFTSCTPVAASFGYDASFENLASMSGGLTDGDFVGVSSFTGTVGSYADGSQGYQMGDVDGIMVVEFNPVSLTGFTSYAFDMDYFVQSTTYEADDSLHIYLVTDAGTLDLLRVDGDDIDNGVVTEGQWIGINQDLTGYTSAQLVIRGSNNAASESYYFDDINFTGSSSPTITTSVDTLNFGGLVEGSSESSVETFTVTASNLTGDITVTGVSGLEISLDGASYSAGPLTISPTSGSVSGATVYARVPNTVTAASGEPTGDVVLTAAGATQVDVAVVATVTAPAADCSELFFSEYIEGSGLNKCLEIYNPTSSAVSLADYTIGMFDGGATNMNASRSFTFPAGTSQSVGAEDVWVGCDSSADADFLAESDTTFGFPSPLSFNGDDAIVLMTPSGIMVDVIGRIGEDPGSYWGSTVQTRNQTLVRLGSIQRGDSDGNDAFDPATEWESFPQNTYQTLGWHNSDCDANNVAVWSGGAGSSDWTNNANWTSGSAPTAAATRIVVPSNPVGGQVFPTYTGGTLTLGNTVVGSGASLNIGAGAVCQIGANATLASAGSIVLESDGSGTAMFDDFSQAGAIFYGTITMQQFVGGIVAAQHYVSSPVNNVPLTEWADDPQELSGYGAGLTGTDGVAVTPASNCSPDSISPSSNYGNLFQWDPETVINTFCPEQAGWVVRSAGNMEDGRGYSAYLAGGNSTLSITGTPNTGDVTYTMDAVGILQNIPLSNWDILGNPYPSSLDRNNLIIGNSGLNSPSYWDPSGTYSGTYQPYTPGSVIPSMQGFAANWNAGGSTADITYTNAMRSTTAGTWRSATIDGDINIELRGNGYGDVTRIFFGEMMTSTFDALEDAYKFESAPGQPTLFTGDDANMLSMNGRSNPVMGDQIALGVMPGQSGSFTLDFTSVAGLPYGSLLFLEDKSEGTWTQVAEGDVYAFTMTELDDYNRFVLHITPAVVVSAEDGDCSVSNGVLHVEAPSFMVEGQEVAWNYVISDAEGVVSTGVLSGAIEMPVHTTGNLTVNLANAYTSLTDVVYVETSVLPVVSLSDVSDEVGNSVSFVSPMIGEWMIDGVVISEGIDFVWTSLAAGTYELEFVGYTELGCEVRTSCTIEMTDKVSSTTDVLLGQSQVLVTEDYVRIVAHGSHTVANLYNMEGKVVASTLLVQSEAMLSTDGLATGVYTLSLEGSAQVESLQLFID